VEFGGLRFLTDPTFDPAGGEYTTGPVTLKKLRGPALSTEEVAPFDYVLLSHDHHFDNLDHAGRRVLAQAKAVLTTDEGARRLGGKSRGLRDWQSIDVQAPECSVMRIVATPARHGSAGMNRGAVCGFVLFLTDTPDSAIYVSGDTVWYEGEAEVAHRFNVRLAILHLGAARVPAVGPFHLTMTAEEAVEAALAFRTAAIAPIHFEDWAHFSEGRDDIALAFEAAGLEQRLRWPERGGTICVDLQSES
jgi:L-ascorbate metabolism protein UlaG (beta-lactamase superfamily)